MTRSVYTLCVFQNLNPVGFCVICAFCGELQAKEMLSEEWKVKSEKSNGLSEDTARKECWATPNQTSCSRFAQAILCTSSHVLMFSCLPQKTCSHVLLSFKKTCSSVLLSPPKKHVLLFSCLPKNHVLLSSFTRLTQINISKYIYDTLIVLFCNLLS